MELFSTEVFPILAEDFEALLKMLPTRVQKAADDKKAKKEKKEKRDDDDHDDKKKDHLTAKLQSVVDEARRAGERRNSYQNLAFTAPHENTNFQRDITYSKVANMAVDMFMNTSLPPGEPPRPLRKLHQWTEKRW